MSPPTRQTPLASVMAPPLQSLQLTPRPACGGSPTMPSPLSHALLPQAPSSPPTKPTMMAMPSGVHASTSRPARKRTPFKPMSVASSAPAHYNSMFLYGERSDDALALSLPLPGRTDGMDTVVRSASATSSAPVAIPGADDRRFGNDALAWPRWDAAAPRPCTIGGLDTFLRVVEPGRPDEYSKLRRTGDDFERFFY